MPVGMNAVTDAEYLPMVRRIAASETVGLKKTQLLPAIAGNNGSSHSEIFSVPRLAKRAARQNSFFSI